MYNQGTKAADSAQPRLEDGVLHSRVRHGALSPALGGIRTFSQSHDFNDNEQLAQGTVSPNVPWTRESEPKPCFYPAWPRVSLFPFVTLGMKPVSLEGTF